MKMEVIQDMGDTFDKAPVVNILSCTENHVTSQNLVQLTHLPTSVLSGTNDADGENYIDFDNPLDTTRIQFVVIDPLSTQLTSNTSNNGKNRENRETPQNTEFGGDRLICGQCQMKCDNVLEFLDHKATHIGRGLGLGCEVCSLTFSRTKSLQQHYRRKHKIELCNNAKRGESCQKGSERQRSVKKNKKEKKSGTIEIKHQAGFKVEPTEEIHIEMKSVEKVRDERYDGEEQGICHNSENVNIVKTNSEVDLYGTDNRDIGIQNLTDWVSSEDISESCQSAETEEAVLQSISKAVDIDAEQIQSLSRLDYVNVPSEHSIRTNNEMENNVQTVTDSDIITTEHNINNISQFSNQSPSSEKENNASDSESMQQSNNEINNMGTIISTVEKSSNFKRDFSNELDMPDFYFITIIERGPRNSIRGGKYHFKCLYCELKLSWRYMMCKHMREKHPDILQMGPVLNLSHQKLEKKYKIIKMSEYVQLEKTTRTGKRMRGIETQDIPGDFSCRKCGKVFHRLRYLRKHEVLHQAEKNLLCSVCVKSFKTLANLNQHMRTHKEREAYKCSQCDFESTINIAIHAHRQIHKDRCVLCDICGCAYNDKSTLTKHKKVHDFSRPFACTHPGCTWRFKSNTMCIAHVRAHTTKAKFECKICNYAFRQKHHLQRHESKIHNITSAEKNCTYTVLPIDFVDEGMIVTDGNNLVEIEPQPVQSEVSLIINENNEVSVDDQFDLESALQSGQLVIATDSEGNTINYEMTDMSSMSVSYQSLLPDSEGQQMDAQTILIPQTDGSQIMYQHEEITETICTEVNTSGDTTV